MRNLIIFTILVFYNFTVTAETYDPNNSIINLKYGFKLGDLIIVQDEIISDRNFGKKPELFIKENRDLKLINQTKFITKSINKHIFTNKITYQIYLKKKSGNYELPAHSYKIDNKNISMPKQSFWFTRVSESKLNNILINSVGQKKHTPIIVSKIYLNFFYGIIFIVLLILFYKNIDLPFLKKMNGPFAKANSKIRKLHKISGKDNYIKSILILTDAFNKTFNKNISSSNFKELINENTKFQEVEGAIKIFVDLSSIEIYSPKTHFTKKRFDEIYNFTKILRTIERKI